MCKCLACLSLKPWQLSHDSDRVRSVSIDKPRSTIYGDDTLPQPPNRRNWAIIHRLYYLPHHIQTHQRVNITTSPPPPTPLPSIPQSSSPYLPLSCPPFASREHPPSHLIASASQHALPLVLLHLSLPHGPPPSWPHRSRKADPAIHRPSCSPPPPSPHRPFSSTQHSGAIHLTLLTATLLLVRRAFSETSTNHQAVVPFHRHMMILWYLGRW